jgi:aubergine-like protein
MEEPIQYLTKPKIKGDKLPYVDHNKEIYVNLFQINIKKPLTLFQYPFKVSPEIEAGDMIIRKKLFKYCGIGEKENRKKLRDFYGECFISGDSLYGMKEVKEAMTFTCTLHFDGETKYTITFQPKKISRTINQNDLDKDPLTKQFIEILIQDILRANPNLDFHKGLFVLKNKEEVIEGKNGSIYFYPGYTTSFMETEGGNYLNVTLKNKILSTQTIYDFLIENEYKDKANHDMIRDLLIGRSFKVKYAKKNYIIDDILFDRNPKTQDFENDEGKTITLKDYYKDKYDIIIKDLSQPLLVSKRKDCNGEDINLYFVPELCNLAGLDDEFIKDRDFMTKLANRTKLTPEDRIKKTNEFLNLLVETKSKDEVKDEKKKSKKDDKKKSKNAPKEESIKRLSPKEKSELYGIEVKALDKLHKAFYMKETTLIGGGKSIVKPKDKIFDVLSKKDMTKWVCLYRKSNYSDAETLDNTLQDASQGYGLAIAEPEWKEMGDRDNYQKWTETAENYMKTGKYSFVIFLLDKNDSIYKHLKIHSLVTCGYVSQVVKAYSLRNKKTVMSVCSKILLQINAKLSGVSYMPKLEDNVKNRKLMIIGVDSSHIKGKRTGVAMVSTINTSFTNFYNKESIIEEKNKEQIQYCIGSFIKEALVQYKKLNKKMPGGIVIYRQGVSLQQKDFLINEVNNIKKVCNENNLLYYYILVNTKTTYKFFEKNKGQFKNPDEGLLVLDGVTNRNFFEFYIQPQKVTGGSATPSCFHVAYGDLDFPEMIPKLTFDLCHLYSNWQGTVRVPHVLKAAEKLSKMTAKYTLGELNENLQVGQSYL